MDCGRAAGGHGGTDVLVLWYARFKVEPSIDLFLILVHFRCSIHLHRRRCAQRSIVGSHKWIRTAVSIVRPCGRTRPSEFDILPID